VLFIFRVGAVSNSIVCVKIPIPSDCLLLLSEQHERGWWNGMNPCVRRQLSGGQKRETSGKIFFAEPERSSGPQDERIEDCTPGNEVALNGVIKVACPDEIRGQDE
jgi:hypothetical protein